MARILTYNVRRCLGLDGDLSSKRIAEVIASCNPDIVALQEIDVRRRRSGGMDQARDIARDLGMDGVYFHPAVSVEGEEYGDAILTAKPSRLVRAGGLPGWQGRASREPRGALWACVHVDGADIQIVATHLSLWRQERLAQVDALLGAEWLGHPACREPVVLLGDFNAVPRSRAYRRLADRLLDVQTSAVGSRRPQPTFPARLPLLRIDHIFVSRNAFEVVRVDALRTELARVASDHLPLFAEISVLHARRRRAA